MGSADESVAFLLVQAGFSGGQDKPGVALAPSAILSSPHLSHFPFSLHGLDQDCIQALEKEVGKGQVGKIHNLQLVSEFNRRLKAEIEGLERGKKILVVGGDHSLAIGSIAAMCCREPGLKVVWIDAHADINTLNRTVSGKLHGCPVSFLLGLEDSSFPWLQPPLKPQDLVYLGLRDVEPQEIELLKTLGIRAFYMSDVRRLGIDAVIREINEFVGEAPVHVSLDVDGIDPEHTGATGTPVPDGLSMEETQSVLRSLRARRWISLDIVEVNLQEGSPGVQALTLDCSLSLISTFLS